jgi:hypothetical protein
MFSTLTITVNAIQFAQSNTNIEIIPGVYTGYRFFGPDSPHSVIDTTQIHYVKFYIKFEDLRHHEPANVLLAYNSGTTGWVTRQHDLNNGLIVEIEITSGGVSLDDFFEAALTTENESIRGTYSVEVRDVHGRVLGQGVYESNIPQSNEVRYDNDGEPDYNPEYTPADEEYEPEYEYEPEEEPEYEYEQPEYEHYPEANPETGGANIITATAMTVVSALAIISMSKRNKKKD